MDAALTKLASATEPEAPRALLAWLPRGRDAVCGAARGVRARVWCHLQHARVRVVDRAAHGAWWVLVELPALSDHVHVVELRRRHGAIEAVRVDSAN